MFSPHSRRARVSLVQIVRKGPRDRPPLRSVNVADIVGNYAPEINKKPTPGRDKAFAFNGRVEISGLPLSLPQSQGTYFTYTSFGRRTDCIIAAFGMIAPWIN